MKWFKKIKNEPWFQMTIALAIVVLLYFILQHIPQIWSVIKFIWKIISPLMVGLIIAYIIDPLVRLIERTVFKRMKKRHTARRISIIISIIIVLIMVGGILWILIPQLVESIQSLISNLNEYMLNLETWLKELGGGFLKDALSDVNFTDISKTLVNWLTSIASGKNIINAGVSVGSGVVNFVISAILAVYFLLAKEKLISLGKRFLHRILKANQYRPFIDFCGNCNKILVKYICYSILEAIVVGAANAIIMTIFGMPYAAIISVAVGVTNLAPTFGPIVGACFGGFILLMVKPIDALIFIIITIILQTLDGYVLKPRLHSGTLGVSALLILISIILCGRLFGVIGILFAIPIAAIIQYVYKQLSAKKFEKKTDDNPKEE